MRRAALILSLSIALGAIATPTRTAKAQDADPAVPGALAEVARRRMAMDGVPGVVIALLRAGDPVRITSLGFADPATGRRMAEDALFRVESISKPVTAWGAMRLAESGRLDLDTPISECLIRWRPPDGVPPVTVRQLLSHDAGIGLGDYAARYAPDAPKPTLAEQLTAEFGLIEAPGSGFAYSDTGYNLLELVIEDCAMEEFGAFMAREVLRPLGMASATYDWTGAEMPAGHDLRGRPVPAYVYPGRGSGGLFATAADMSRFAAAGMAGAEQDVLSPEAVAETHYPVVEVGGLFGVAADGYALGHFTETLSDGRAAVWHGGQGHGWMSHIHLVPESGDGIVILTNGQRAWPLIAVVLREWSDSLGVAPVGMTRVLKAEWAARATIVLLLAVAVLCVRGAARPRPRLVRVGGGLAAALLIGWPLWAAAQDYLFLFSILPGLWPWLGAASALTGLAATAVAFAPDRSS